MRIWSCLILILLCLNLLSQTEESCLKRLEKAEVDYTSGEYPQALAQFEKIVEECLGADTILAVDIHFKIAACFFHGNDLKSVEAQLAKMKSFENARHSILRESNFESLMLYNRTRLMKSKGMPSEALSLIDQCIEKEQQRDCDGELLLAQAYNEKGNILLMLNEIDEAKRAYRLANVFCQEGFMGTAERRIIDATVLGNLGVCHHYQSNFDSAMYYYEQSKVAFDLMGDGGSEDLMRMNYNMALILESRGYLDGALEMYESSLAFYQNKYGATHKEIAKAYGAIGYNHHLRGDDATALVPFLKDVSISESLYGADHPFVAEALLNVALSHYQLNDLVLAEQTLNRVIVILKKQYGATHLELSEAYNRMALVRHEQGDLNDAIDYLSESIRIQEELRGKSSVDYIQMNVRQAQYYLEAKRMDLALVALENAKTNLRITFNHKNFEYVNVYNVLARAYRQNNQMEFTNRYLDSTCQIIYDKSISELPPQSFTKFEKSFPNLAFDFLHEQLKFNIYSQEKNQDKDILEAVAFAYIDRGIKLSRSIIDQYNSEQNAVVFVKKQRAFMTDAIYFSSKIYEQSPSQESLRTLFAYTELAKGAILRGNVNQVKSKSKSNQSEITILKNRLRYWNSELEYKLNNAYSEEKIMEVRFKLEQTLDEYTSLLNQGVESHEDNNYDIYEVIDLLLNLRQTTVLSYFRDIHRELLYCFVLSHGGLKVEVKRNNDLESMVSGVRRYLEDYRSEVSVESEISQLSEDLILHNVLSSSKKMLIIPDGVLNQLPFEILLDGEQELVQGNNIAYAPSADLYFSNSQKKYLKRRMFAIAPSFVEGDFLSNKERNDFAPLYGALTEVNDIKSIVPTKLVSGEKATESTFKKLASQYRFLHIASHAQDNAAFPMRSYLKFSEESDHDNDGYLYMNELYDLPLNADLVTLSACNTGSGTIVEGEGVLSLARNFKYAGADNVLMSLWKVPDKETSEIMRSFYRYLSQSNDASKALRKAKLDYLTYASETRKHPFYWAGFVLHGSDGKVKMPSKRKRKKHLIVCFVVVIYLGFWGYRQIGKRET